MTDHAPATLRDVFRTLEALAPPSLQADYDNAGLLVGDEQAPLRGVLLTLDCTEAVVAEAVATGCNLIVAHHPIIFRGLKRLTGRTYVERTVMAALRHGVAIYAAHTNLDHVSEGINAMLAERLGLQRPRILQPLAGRLQHLTVLVPPDNLEAVRAALHAAGAGHVGAYSHCSFRTEGTGAFRPGEAAQPHIGTRGQLEEVCEARLEVLVPNYRSAAVLAAMRAAHPYEEVAYFLAPLDNLHQGIGIGMIGTLAAPMDERDFLLHLKARLDLAVVRHTPLRGRPIARVAVCGGTGAFLLGDARRQGADAFVTADVKYHEFFDAEGELVLADVGHYESEVGIKAWLARHLREKMPNIAVRLSSMTTNPVQYL